MSSNGALPGHRDPWALDDPPPQIDEEGMSSPVHYADGGSGALQIRHGPAEGSVRIQDSLRLAQTLIERQKDLDLSSTSLSCLRAVESCQRAPRAPGRALRSP